MKSVRVTIRKILLSAAVAAPFVMAVSATTAAAGERARNVTRTGPDGKQLQGMRNRSLQDGHYESHSSWTGANGKTASRDTVGDYDADTRKWTRDTTSVGPNGKTATTHAEVQKTDTGYSRDVTHTGRDGQQSSSHTDFVKTEDGFERSKTMTGPNGKTTTADTTLTRTEDGSVRETVITRPNGETVTKEVTRTRTPAP